MQSQIFLIENDAFERTSIGRLLRANGYSVSEHDSVLSFVHGIDYESLKPRCLCFVRYDNAGH